VGAGDDQSMGRRSDSELIPSSEMVELACEGGLLEKMKILELYDCLMFHVRRRRENGGSFQILFQ
jgi:hypothetical protein